MPGGFGTLDEFMEIVTLIQTLKIKKKLPIVLFGTEYWKEIINFEAMAKWGMINHEDIALFHRTDSVDDAFEYMTRELRHYLNEPQPAEGIGSPSKRVPATGSIDAP
jgi:predicted Rossmann-fold nucleotide-binding protein